MTAVPASPGSAAARHVRRADPRSGHNAQVYFTDRGIEELDSRRGEESVNMAWLAERLREFTDSHPEFEVAVERLATWLARYDDAEEEPV